MDWLPKNWQEWAAFATVVQLIVVVLALLYAKRQLREVMRSRNLDATKQLLNEIGAPDLRMARTYVLDRSEPISRDLSNVSKEELDIIRSVAVAYDRVGYMIKQDLIPEKALFDFQREEIEQLWQKIEPVILYFQQDRGRPNYCRHFKDLATEWLPEMKRKHG